MLKPQKRLVASVHRGTRIRGLIRQESEYLMSPKGLPYALNESTIGSLKSFLGQKYALNDKTLLQVLTHKSFAHGKKPFNEKLAVLGCHFLKYKLAIYTFNAEGLENIGSPLGKQLFSPKILASFVEKAKFGDFIFWKNRDPLETNPKLSGQESVYARTCEALIGALLLQHGKSVATTFINEMLLSGENSILKLASPISNSQHNKLKQ